MVDRKKGKEESSCNNIDIKEKFVGKMVDGQNPPSYQTFGIGDCVL